nr:MULTISPECIES: hypothetical protein [unclassified Rhizobium]
MNEEVNATNGSNDGEEDREVFKDEIMSHDLLPQLLGVGERHNICGAVGLNLGNAPLNVQTVFVELLLDAEKNVHEAFGLPVSKTAIFQERRENTDDERESLIPFVHDLNEPLAYVPHVAITVIKRWGKLERVDYLIGHAVTSGASKKKRSSHSIFRFSAAKRIAFISSRDGAPPFSQRDTVACVTPAREENSAWLTLKTFFRMCFIVLIDTDNMRKRIICKRILSVNAFFFIRMWR